MVPGSLDAWRCWCPSLRWSSRLSPCISLVSPSGSGGWYQALPTSPFEVNKDAPAEYTIAVVDRAIRYYKANGRAGAVGYYNKPESADGEWYVFIVDEDRNMLAHIDPALVGRNVRELGTDVDGNNLADLAVPEGGRWVHYEFQNPATGEKGIKHSWVVLYDGAVIGSGWYE